MERVTIILKEGYEPLLSTTGRMVCEGELIKHRTTETQRGKKGTRRRGRRKENTRRKNTTLRREKNIGITGSTACKEEVREKDRKNKTQKICKNTDIKGTRKPGKQNLVWE